MKLPHKHYFLSYTREDRDWAAWLGHVLINAGCTVSNHEWDIAAGENIIKWMNDKLASCDHIIGLFSNCYLKGEFSSAEVEFGTYDSIVEHPGKIIPIVVRPCDKMPALIQNLRRLHVEGFPEKQTENMVVDFLSLPMVPKERPPFPGADR